VPKQRAGQVSVVDPEWFKMNLVPDLSFKEFRESGSQKIGSALGFESAVDLLSLIYNWPNAKSFKAFLKNCWWKTEFNGWQMSHKLVCPET
jgi:hypothetical protein